VTAATLLGLILAALALQLTLGVGIAAWRRQRHPRGVRETASSVSPVAAGAGVGWREFRVVRRTFEDAAQTQCSFYLQPEDGQPLPPFEPGQYLTFDLRLDADPTENAHRPRPLTRCYSLSDRPDPAAYRITVKRVPAPADRPELPPGAASNHLHDRVHEGDLLRVKAPAGRFCIDAEADVPAVFVAGGIGITPMMSMLRWCITEQPQRSVHLFYGVRSGADHAFKSTLETLAREHPAFRLHCVYSHPRPDDVLGRDYRHRGRIDAELLRANLPHGRHRFYVCGPPPMMQSLVPALRDWGVPEDDLRFEAFGPATVRAAQPPVGGPSTTAAARFDVRFARSGRTLVWDGQDASLLEFAERHGVPVESGCRSGSCGSCEIPLEAGQVVYAERPDHELAEGRCLLCVGRPGSDLVLRA
jgi:uncharacterized protein